MTSDVEVAEDGFGLGLRGLGSLGLGFMGLG